MKSEEDDILVYDEDEAVKYILENLPEGYSGKLQDTQVEYVLDVIYDYYDEQGLVDEDTAEEASIDEEDMFKYIRKCAKKDKMDMSDEDIQVILDGEFAYGQSLGIYD